MQPIVITGATGTLGRAFARICDERNLRYRLTSRDELDIADAGSVEAMLARHRPWLVVNTAGYVRVDDAEDDRERCHRENAIGAETLADGCARHGAGLVTFSSDLVFDGAKGHPYDEDDRPAPLNVYGRSKAVAEQRVLEAHPGALVVRTSAFFGPWDEHNLVTHALRELSAGRTVRVPDAVVSPTYVPDLVHACLDLAIDGEGGLWHLANRGTTSWASLVKGAAHRARLIPDREHDERIRTAPHDAIGLRAPRPRYSALGTRRGAMLPELDDAVARYVRDRAAGAGW
jgi:dTDP-4-dehydrorhamnose reductase